jgi:hypothetical protein
LIQENIYVIITGKIFNKKDRTGDIVLNKKGITKPEVKNLIKDLDFSVYKYIGFVITNDKVEIVCSNEFDEIGYCLNGFIEQWKDKEYTLKETVTRVQEYMCEKINFYKSLENLKK